MKLKSLKLLFFCLLLGGMLSVFQVVSAHMWKPEDYMPTPNHSVLVRNILIAAFSGLVIFLGYYGYKHKDDQ